MERWESKARKKLSHGESLKGENERWRRSERERERESEKREDAVARKGREVAKHCVFPMF